MLNVDPVISRSRRSAKINCDRYLGFHFHCLSLCTDFLTRLTRTVGRLKPNKRRPRMCTTSAHDSASHFLVISGSRGDRLFPPKSSIVGLNRILTPPFQNTGTIAHAHADKSLTYGGLVPSGWKFLDPPLFLASICHKPRCF